MTALPNVGGLVRLTLTDPAAAARLLIGLQLPQSALWSALALAAAGQAILFGLSNVLFPGPAPLPALFAAPLSFFGMVLVALVLSVYGMLWGGRILGGEGDLNALLVLCVWLQFLRVAVQALMLVLSQTLPILVMLLSLAATIAGVYILLHFVNQAHRLHSLPRAFGVMMISFVIVAVGLSVLLSVTGAQLQGSFLDV